MNGTTIEERYEQRTKKSKSLLEEAKKYIPHGVGSNLRKFDPHPFFVETAKGAKVTDADGNEYIDFSMNYGAQLVGHAHPAITTAINKQAQNGTLYTMPHKLSAEFAKEIVKRFPVDQVRFTNSGTETTMHAIRLARGYTDRDKLVMLEGGYHGAHDYVMGSFDSEESEAGIPNQTLESVLFGTFNNLESIKKLFDRHEGEIAAVIVEPVMMNRGIILPANGFLQELRELCKAHGALLIFDEIKTGVKVEWGGACQYYGVEPDIVCLSKSIAGGLPLGAFGAKREIMSAILNPDGVTHSGTFNSNPLCIIAGLITLRDILKKDVYEDIFRLSANLARGFQDIISKYNLVAHVVYIGPCGTLFFTDKPITDHNDFRDYITDKRNERVAKMFYLEMLNHGIIPHPVGFDEEWTISIQHTDKDIERYLEAFNDIAPELAEVQKRGGK